MKPVLVQGWLFWLTMTVLALSAIVDIISIVRGIR